MLPESGTLETLMQRLVAIIVVLFVFAAVAGPTTAHAHRYVSTPIVVLNLVDADNVSVPVMVSVQRGDIDLGSGIVMPCGPHQAIPIAETQPPAPFHSGMPNTILVAPAPQWLPIEPLRPPRTA